MIHYMILAGFLQARMRRAHLVIDYLIAWHSMALNLP